MQVLTQKMTIADISSIRDFPNGFVKGVVDLEKRLVAIDADMHYELADYLKQQRDSKEKDMWGFNLWLDNEGMENVLEFDSFINIHQNQLHGFPRGGMDIKDPEIRKQAEEVICEWIQF